MIAWIHGAFSTSRSFNYLIHYLPDNALRFEYSETDPLEYNIERLVDEISKTPVRGVVGHSLGGVISAIINKRHGIKGAAIASPLGGFGIGNVFPMMQVLQDTASLTSPIIRELKSHKFSNDFLSICTELPNRNTDGVVPLRSQMALKGSVQKKVDTNHFEVLLDPRVGAYLDEHFA
jgi:pimeloyl-ACP methyl ester carboxylesterase